MWEKKTNAQKKDKMDKTTKTKKENSMSQREAISENPKRSDA